MASIRSSTEQPCSWVHDIIRLPRPLQSNRGDQMPHRHIKRFTLSHMYHKLKVERDKPCIRGIMYTVPNARHNLFYFSSDQPSLQKFRCFSKPNPNSKALGVS